MALVLDLEPSLTKRLKAEALRRGIPEATVVEELLRAKLPAPASLADLLEEWAVADRTNDEPELARRDDDLATLKDALNAGHSADRRLFP